VGTRIEWCDETLTPILGCTRLSEGCEHCYAERLAGRHLCPDWCGLVDQTGWTGKVVFRAKRLEALTRWRRPRRVFVGSMGDLFHQRVPDVWLDIVFDALCRTHHTVLLLTKRPGRALSFSQRHGARWPSNAWFGVTTENQARAEHRIPVALAVPAAVHFVSAEPLLGPLDISQHLERRTTANALNTTKINWVITGPETGPCARPCSREWLESLRDQTTAAGVPFFLKGRLGLGGRRWEELP
jgi:protein gp37